METDKVIFSRRTIRQYTSKNLTKKQIIKIIEAGRWGPSVHNSQPWQYIIIRKKKIVDDISKVLNVKSKHLLTGFDIIIKETARIISNARTIVAVYNTCELSNRMKKFDEPYYSIAKCSEVQSISGSIENMLLMAHFLGLGAAWLTSPLFFEKEINSLLNIKSSLLAILTFGYPSNDIVKSDRKSLKKIAKYIQ
jgi:nitroreductase